MQHVEKLYQDARFSGLRFSIKTRLDDPFIYDEILKHHPEISRQFDSYDDLAETLSSHIAKTKDADSFAIVVDENGDFVAFEAYIEEQK